MLGAAPWLLQQGVQLVCLGTGSANLEDGLRWLEFTYRWGAWLVAGWVAWLGLGLGLGRCSRPLACTPARPSWWRPGRRAAPASPRQHRNTRRNARPFSPALCPAATARAAGWGSTWP